MKISSSYFSIKLLLTPLLITLISAGYTFAQAPVIGNFVPAIGPIGGTVTIYGSGFGTTVAQNIVYFGAVRATVTAVNEEAVTVTVPFGSTYQPISVLNTATGLTGYSAKPFIPIFTPNKKNITKNDLQPPVTFNTGGACSDIAIADIDGDGKPDLVMANENNNSISILRNISANGAITSASFAPKIDIPVSTPYKIALSDLDGDGRLDLVVTSVTLNKTVFIFKNVSSPGSITANSFAPAVGLTFTGSTTKQLAVNDLDGDGKPDIVVTDGGSSDFIVFRNAAITGTLAVNSFESGFQVNLTAQLTNAIAIGDLDGDGKPDLAVSGTDNTVSIIKNQSTPGQLNDLSFAAPIKFIVGDDPTAVVICDLDGDGKPELITANAHSTFISVLYNASITGAITINSFANAVNFNAGSSPGSISVGDLDGDGKPDLAVVKVVVTGQNTTSDSVSVFRNTATLGSISTNSFATKVDYYADVALAGVAVGDLDGDGKPDISAISNNSGTTGNHVAVFRNNPVNPPTVAANNITFTNITTNSATVNWINGNGSARAVFIGAAAAVNKLPANSTFYKANSVYGSGAQIDSSGWYCAYNGIGSLATITGLSSNAAYKVMVIEYTGSPGSENYLTYVTSGNSGFTTLPGGPVAINSINDVDYSVTSSATVKFLATFAAPVTGVNPGNFVLVTTGTIAGASVTSIVDPGGAADTVIVNTGTGNGTIGLNLVNDSGITPGILPPLPFTGQAYTIDRTIPIPKPPVITSYTPAKGPDGTTITITGTGFATTAANNTVYFGATIAPVVAANATSLTVKVPVGATYNTLSVLNNSTALTGYSDKFFLPTFNPAKGNINKGDFIPPVSYNTGGGSVFDITIADIDGDGKPDLIIPNGYVISIYRNTSSNGSITSASFAAKVDITAFGVGPLLVADLDGDGKPDLVTIGIETNETSIMYIYRNTSVRGSINTSSFAPLVKIPLPDASYGYITTGDFDGDGRPDIVVGSGGGSMIIYRNKSSKGSITSASFQPQSKIIVGNQPYAFGTLLAVADMDGDGKPDIISNGGGGDSVAVYRNLSVTGALADLVFAPPIGFAAGKSLDAITIGDLDGDGKPEIITPNEGAGTFSVLHNTAVSGSITNNSFAPKVDFVTGGHPCSIKIGDLDGDGKPDLAVVKGVFEGDFIKDSDSISVYRNTSTIGFINSTSLAAKVDFRSGDNSTVGGGLFALAVGDLDGDGKADLVAAGSRTFVGANASINPLYILRNNPVFPPNIQASNIVFTSTGTNTTTASWTNGNGTTRAVFIKLVSTGTPMPVQSTTYAANTAFGSGSQIGTSGWYCIYNGTGSTVNITGLSSGATYQVMVVEYTGIPGGENYLTTFSTGNPANVTTLTGGAVAINVINSITTGVTNAATLQYDATFASTVKGLKMANFVLATTGLITGAGITSVTGSGANYTITVNTGTGDGTIGLNLASATGLMPAIITPLPFTGAVDTIDRTLPTITVSNPSVTSVLSGTGSVTYAVAYADTYFKASTLSPANITLISTGTAKGIISVSGSGKADTVTISNITGSGSLGISIAKGTASDLAGNAAPAAGPSATFLVNPVLSNLTISSGVLSPAFTSTGFSYNTPVDNSIATLLVTPVAADPGAVVTVNGAKPSIPVNLSIGFNDITITVTSPDGKAFTTYTLGVTRAAASTSGLAPKIAYGNGNIVITGSRPFSVLPANTGGAVPATTFGQVTTFAGSPTETAGYLNATGTAALFSAPQQPVTDALGNLYLADAGNNAIRKITPTGEVTTFAGSPAGVAGLQDGTGAAALFNAPDGIAADGSGNLFVADYGNNVIRKITPSGTVSTFYNPLVTFGPAGITTDAAGNLIVAAQDASQIIRISPSGVATVIAGTTPGYLNGPVSAAQFNNPTDVKSDAAGNYFVADFENNAIRKISASGIVTTLAGSAISGNPPGYAPGVGTSAVFNNPSGVNAGPGGIIYVCDIFNNDIRSIAADGTVSIIAGNAAQVPGDADGIGTAAGFNLPVYMTIDPSGTGYVAEYGGNRVRKLVLTGYTLKGSLPQGLAFDPTTGTISGTPVIPFNATTDTVTAYNAYGFSTTVVTIAYHVPSTVATLINLVPGSGILTPVFASNTTAYTDAVPNSTTSITLTPTATDTTAMITVNGIAVASGKASAAIPLIIGDNILTTIVTAQDGITKDTYTLTVTRAALSTVATLNNLHLSQGTLTPAFATGITDYTAAVANIITSVTVTPVSSDPKATIQVNGTIVLNARASGALPLNVGPNPITTVVTAQDGTTTDTYTIIVTRAPSADATLGDLALSSGPLTPIFTGGTLNYSAGVANAITSETVTPVTTDPNATITVNGLAVISGTASAAIPLAVGPNTITTIITAQDGVTKDTYTIIVTRAPDADATLLNLAVSQGIMSPAFNSASKSYTDNVPNATTSITVTPTTSDGNAAITVNGAVVTSGTASTQLPLAVGPNTITTTVTAQDGTTTDSYTIIVTRAPDTNAMLLNLAVSQGTLAPAFTSAAKSYTDDVPNSIISITVTPTTSDNTATLKVNGNTVTSGTASAPVELNVGPNTINTTVTAADGITIDTYTVIVTRAPNADATLIDLTVNRGTLSPVFSNGTKAYTDTVLNTVTGITVTPTVNNSTATITVNGTAVKSGTPSDDLPLVTGANTITVTVTAQDGITKETYTLTVYRGADITTLDVNNVLTPNGDGKNDVWVIKDIQLYPQNNVTVYDKAGRIVYAKRSYNNDWDGTLNGQPLAEGTYYYLIDLGPNLRKVKGYIGILRN